MEFIDLKAQYATLKTDIDKNIHMVLDSSQYMMGDFVKQLEKELAAYVGAKYCVTCANGTDALQLALMTWDIKEGDAVFVPSFTFYATAEVVSLMGATPIFIDCDSRTFNIDPQKLEQSIEKVLKENRLRPKVIIPVDLFGQTADYISIARIAKKYDLLILEDGAQGFGGSINNEKACSFGHISTTSFFPAKPLGCYGDGGALFTDNEEYYNILLSLRVHGKGSFKYDNVRVGLNSRLDTLQAGVLLPKLAAFKGYELEKRNKIAQYYSNALEKYVITPLVPKGMQSSWAQYTVLLNSEDERNALQSNLKEEKIPTMIYYPKPLHQQTVYEKAQLYNSLSVSEAVSKTCLSLPMHPYLEMSECDHIISSMIKNLTEIRNGQ